ncbi:MAG TPA: hypothetical protein VKB80_07870 [Kofleriaceae bacterium]|nr:hypothetical protein [Kofleriaceae bacterium]
MKPTGGGDVVSRQLAPLRREVLVPVPSYRRASYLVALGVLLVLVASAVDAVVWTYQSQRRFWRQEAVESLRPVATRLETHRRHASRSSCPHWSHAIGSATGQ